MFGVADTQRRLLDGMTYEFGSPAFDALLDESASALFGDLTPTAPLVILTSPPLLPDRMPEPRTAAYFADHGIDRIAHLNEVLAATSDRTS